MPSCVRVGFPVLHPPTIVSDDNYSFLHSSCGIHSSWRRHRYFSLNELSTWEATWDLNTARNIEYFFIARADLLTLVSSIILEESADGITWTAVDTITAPLALSGPDSRDLYFELTSPIFTRYFRVSILHSSTVKTSFSKIYFGELFDFEVNPSTSSQEFRRSATTTPFRTTSGKLVGARTSKPVYEYPLVFEGVSLDTTKSFLNKVLYDYNLYVVAVGTEEFFNGHEVIHGYISAPKITREAGGNKIEFDFVEMSG